VIVDSHTHVFPREVIEHRGRYVAADATFAALYASPRARLAGADDLLASMDDAGIDASVALGFAWSSPETVRLHNHCLIEAASASNGRLIPFCTLPLAASWAEIEAEARRCIAAGARGFGELRPDNLNFDLAGSDGVRLGRLATELGVVLLFHVSEPVGHLYPGKDGLEVGTFYRFVVEHPEVRMIGAHWGGGLPFYALMPEVRLALRNVRFDTAATSLLYGPEVYRRGVDTAGAASVLFGSDFPLLSQSRSHARIDQAEISAEERELILGENARRFLDLG
jgi:predicted TIM-barrel fold metal-dependent hydrolase